MVRARGLKALKIEGPQIVWVQPWVDYIGCNLKCLILRYVNLNVSNSQQRSTCIRFCALEGTCEVGCLYLWRDPLQMDILREILGRSGESLRILHIEHVTSLDRELLGNLFQHQSGWTCTYRIFMTGADFFSHFLYIAQLIGTCVPGLQQLTVIIPDTVALERNNLELAGIMDSAMAAPLLSVQSVIFPVTFSLRFLAQKSVYRHLLQVHVLRWPVHI